MVSVIVNNYNYGHFLKACLTSVVTQDYPNFECLVVDDASTDNSASVVEDWIGENPSDRRFELLVRPENGGQMAALRTGIEQASGAFLAFLDADDLLLTDFLSKHLAAHLELPT
ncbi:MAG: glycosyltransferase family 2 protein, partial [Pseudomonadota bacterium]